MNEFVYKVSFKLTDGTSYRVRAVVGSFSHALEKAVAATRIDVSKVKTVKVTRTPKS